MKKKLLPLTLALLLGATIQAQDTGEQSLTFSYSAGAMTSYVISGVTPGKTRVYLAFELRADDVTLFNGNAISTINVTGGSNNRPDMPENTIRDINVFITEDLSKEPVYKQQAELTSEWYGLNEIKLDKPFELTEEMSGKPLYIGYDFIVPGADASYMVTDGKRLYANNLIYGKSDTDALPDEWTAAGMTYGALCMSITISGKTLPLDRASVTKAEYPDYVALGSTASYKYTVRNTGMHNIESAEIAVTVGDQEPQYRTVTFRPSLEMTEESTLTIEDILFETEGFANVKTEVSKVNGQPNDGASVSGLVTSYTDGFDRYLVLEEGTGTWCGWCPAGEVMVSYAKKTYPERYICIAVHYNDRMTCDDYRPFLNAYFTGYPSAIVNRQVRQSPGTTDGPGDNYQFIDNMYKAYTGRPAYACFKKLEANPTDDGYKVTAQVEFSIDSPVKHELSFVVVKDHVGPYEQTNYYTEGANGEMGGWENRPSPYSMYFDDVPVDYHAYPGIEGSLPTTQKKDLLYDFTAEFIPAEPLDENCSVIGLITNSNTGEIVNALKVPYNYSGVDATAADSVSVIVAAGGIVVTGASESAIYAADGRKVGADKAFGLTGGIYIVKADGQTRKVMVK